MSDQVLALFVWQQVARATLLQRVSRDEAGEGVISAAIAVLVMAFLGVLMWQLFRDTLDKTNTNVNNQLDSIK